MRSSGGSKSSPILQSQNSREIQKPCLLLVLIYPSIPRGRREGFYLNFDSMPCRRIPGSVFPAANRNIGSSTSKPHNLRAVVLLPNPTSLSELHSENLKGCPEITPYPTFCRIDTPVRSPLSSMLVTGSTLPRARGCLSLNTVRTIFSLTLSLR